MFAKRILHSEFSAVETPAGPLHLVPAPNGRLRRCTGSQPSLQVLLLAPYYQQMGYTSSWTLLPGGGSNREVTFQRRNREDATLSK